MAVGGATTFPTDSPPGSPHRLPPSPTGRVTASSVREMTVTVQRLDNGRLRLSPTAVSAHVATATTPAELARALQSCFTEAEIAGYARRRGTRPDIALLSAVDSFDEPTNLGGKPVVTSWASAAPAGDKRAAGRVWASGGSRERDPADYTANSDGSWTSPSGRTVRDPERCRQIVRRRRAAGLSTLPDDCSLDLSTLADTIVDAARAAEMTPFEWLEHAIAEMAKPAPAPVANLAAVKERKRARQIVDDGQLELPLGLTCPVPARHLEAVA